MYNKRCLEKKEGDTIPQKSFKILSLKSFVGLWLSKWRSRQSIGEKNDRRVIFFILVTWVAVKL